MPRAYFRPLTDKHVVRSVIVRDERDGLDHVDLIVPRLGGRL